MKELTYKFKTFRQHTQVAAQVTDTFDVGQKNLGEHHQLTFDLGPEVALMTSAATLPLMNSSAT